jgi:ubiquinone/menaquinone biosynthesis C-methylase UbiE
MVLKRDFTKYLNYVFDNVIPPVLRDSRYFMMLFFYPLFGRKYRYFMEYKKKAFLLSEGEFNDYYKLLEDRHIKRETDLNKKTIKYIIDNITGETVLDLACGRGYLVKLLSRLFPGKMIFGMDIIIPEIADIPDNLQLRAGNIEAIDFPDKYFDTVICAHTLEHVQNIDIAINELRRVCRKKLIIVVPRQREYKYTFDLHLHFFPTPNL